ncbi:porin family protein [Mesonia aquimarina]|uniref:porin family protein n=1 Tax=Mesonia aquimarina TaxID=1504967 RepID=UPI000EF5B28B|nr:porin family protein [Mesonia aquimarina]
MIKKFIFFAFILTSNTVISQNFEVGVQGGYGLSNIHFEGTSSHSIGVGNVGIIGQYNFDDRWSILAKALYDRKGFKYSSIRESEIKETLQYIDFPLMAKFHLSHPKEDVRFYIQAGGFFGLFQSAENTTSIKQTDVSDSYETVDYGAAFGLGLEIWVTEKLSILVDTEVNIGVADISADPNQNLTSSATKFSAGLLYSIN